MLALGFGLTAALIWAVHDLLARKLSQGVALLPMLVVVLGAGCAVLVPASLIAGDWAEMTAASTAIATASVWPSRWPSVRCTGRSAWRRCGWSHP